jgi:hypothetical protein
MNQWPPRSVDPTGAWFSRVTLFAQAFISTLVHTAFRSECASTSVEFDTGSATGSGANSVVSGTPSGVIENTTGATANSFQLLRSKGGTAAPFIANLRTSKYAVVTCARLSAIPATYVHLLCNATDASSDTFIGTAQATSAVNWITKVGSAAAVDSGVAYDTNYHTFALLADGTNITFHVGNQDGSGLNMLGTSAQSTAPSAAGHFDFWCQNLATAAAASARLDSIIVLTESPSSSQ